ncbi:multicopper oxidase-domain-containing protein [Immersiella caudata]|uniref:Multicopper oxidase-domain-containing protein n=1 Tax=Immersiella caudata TaxID=314043 RepID=A0AA39T201_9PEZI|nr:multicopper oxidase-domain-containing protein [Immersiella caudata]
MKQSLASVLALAAGTFASIIPYHNSVRVVHEPTLKPRQACENTPTSRQCWGEYSLDTNYYEVTPDTGRTVEYWLSAEEHPCAPDGYSRTCMTFNGTIPGPTIIANWGDNIKIHVTNNMVSNGTAIHWHGVHQRNTVLADGVPGVTQCPIAPGQSMTYEFRATQYGSSWYHSHFSLQYSEGLFGGMIFHGPATDNYDEDLGTLLLQDWSHIETFNRWNVAKLGRAPTLESSLINGTNTFNCAGSTDPKCIGGGKKFEMAFTPGTKYLLRLVNVAIDGVFQFSIDGHSLTVIGADFVPIRPYTTSSLQITIGQRYDVIVTALPSPSSPSYWLRGGWISRCAPNANIASITAIVRYNTSDTADPTTTSTVTPSTHCLDEPLASTIPHLPLDVTNIPPPNLLLENLNFTTASSFFQWTINSSSLVLDWKSPTMDHIFRNESLFPTPYNVVPIGRSSPDAPTEWAVLIIQDVGTINLAHPIHLHGHDFWVLAQATGRWDGTTNSFNTRNPTRRDVATLPGGGYLAMAFQLDNPGAWLVHCHIAWHASQGLSLEFVEDQGEIVGRVPEGERSQFERVCEGWRGHTPVWEQDDSGI